MTDKNMGWQCPKCLVVYAPSVDKCQCSALPTVSLSGGFVVGTGGVGTITATDDKCKIYLCSGYISESSNGVCSKCGQPEWKHNNDLQLTDSFCFSQKFWLGAVI